MWAAPRSWKRAGAQSPMEPPEGTSPAETLILSLWDCVGWLKESQDKKVVFYYATKFVENCYSSNRQLKYMLILECNVQSIDVSLTFPSGTLLCYDHIPPTWGPQQCRSKCSENCQVEGPPVIPVVKEESRWHRRTLQTAQMRLIANCTGKNFIWFWAFWFSE